MAKVINSEQNAQVEDFESWLTQLLPLVYRLCSYLLHTATGQEMSNSNLLSSQHIALLGNSKSTSNVAEWGR